MVGFRLWLLLWLRYKHRNSKHTIQRAGADDRKLAFCQQIVYSFSMQDWHWQRKSWSFLRIMSRNYKSYLWTFSSVRWIRVLHEIYTDIDTRKVLFVNYLEQWLKYFWTMIHKTWKISTNNLIVKTYLLSVPYFGRTWADTKKSYSRLDSKYIT